MNSIIEYKNFGYEKFGPLLFGFVNWLINEFQENKETKIFFFARDGYMMERAFKLLNRNITDFKYVYFSRKSIRQALLYHTIDFRDSLKYISKERYLNWFDILEYYGFNLEESKGICKENNLNPKEQIAFYDLTKDKRVELIFKDYQKKIYLKSQYQASLLKEYLNEIGFKDKVAIVDIGWHGSMQYYIEEFCRQHDIKIEVHGYYLGTQTIPEVIGKTFGYIYSDNNLQRKKDLLCCFGLLERLFQSKQGSTYGYKSSEGIIKPIFAEYEYKNDVNLVKLISIIQNSALHFIKDHLKTSYDFKNKDNYILPLIKIGKKPSLADIKLFKDFYLLDGKKAYFVSQKSIFKSSPKNLIKNLINSPWKTGFLKSVFKLPLPYYKIYDWMKK